MAEIDVSVIVPAYNEDKVISDCLNSLISMDYPANKFEILVINDGSKDQTESVVKEFEKKYTNVHLFSKNNEGKSSAQNMGLTHANGKNILIIDADTVVEKDWIKKMLHSLDNADVVLGSCYAKNPRNWVEKLQNANYLVMYQYNGHWGTPIIGANNGFRKNVVDQIGKFNEHTTSVTEDFIFRARRAGLRITFKPEIKSFTICTDSIMIYLRQKLRWRETISRNIPSLLYTEGLSSILLVTSLFSLMYGNGLFLLLMFTGVFFLNFAPYFGATVRMAISREDRTYLWYYIMNMLILNMIRYLHIPYLIFRAVKPRIHPTFHTERT